MNCYDIEQCKNSFQHDYTCLKRKQSKHLVSSVKAHQSIFLSSHMLQIRI